MAYYFIAQIKINDQTEYQKYIAKAGQVSFGRIPGNN